MVDKIIVVGAKEVTILSGYFDFNGIPYTVIDLWNTEIDRGGRVYPSDDLIKEENSLLVIHSAAFRAICEWEPSKKRLIDFSNRNKLWVWNDIDGLVNFLQTEKLESMMRSYVNEFKNITVFLDGFDRELLKDPKFVEFPNNWFMRMPRIMSGCTDKSECEYDFLLTATLKEFREHRPILINDLYSREVSAHGLISCATIEQKDSTWVGNIPLQHKWKDGHPAMDIYNNCWFEILPETLHRRGYFFTEKTNKPIATKTPFLVLSTKGYLGYLKKLGFKTFDSLIDESYDIQDSVEERAKFLLDQVEDIIKNGSESFYRAASEILEHNQQMLCKIHGEHDLLFDSFISKQLEQINFKK